jgi:hypothetical protein
MSPQPESLTQEVLAGLIAPFATATQPCARSPHLDDRTKACLKGRCRASTEKTPRALLADCANDTVFRPRIVGRKLVLLRDHFVILGNGGEFTLGH